MPWSLSLTAAAARARLFGSYAAVPGSVANHSPMAAAMMSGQAMRRRTALARSGRPRRCRRLALCFGHGSPPEASADARSRQAPDAVRGGRRGVGRGPRRGRRSVPALARNRRGRSPLARLVRLTRGYVRSSLRLGARSGTTTGRKVAATIRALEHARTLPDADDVEALIPPVLRAYIRQVQGTSLWIWYTATDEAVTLRALTVGPPS
jgi:hypothetical protein